MKRNAATEGDDSMDDDIDPHIKAAELHNLQTQQPECEWIELPDALLGPAHVAKTLIQRCQEKRSTPTKPYKINEEQLQCIALFVSRLETAFAKRPDLSQPWLHPVGVLMTIIMDGGGGCEARR